MVQEGYLGMGHSRRESPLSLFPKQRARTSQGKKDRPPCFGKRKVFVS